MTAILEPHVSGFRVSGTVPADVAQKILSIIGKFDKKQFRSLCGISARGGRCVERHAETDATFHISDSHALSRNRRLRDHHDGGSHNVCSVHGQSEFADAGTPAITVKGPHVLFHYSQHVIGGENQTVT